MRKIKINILILIVALLITGFSYRGLKQHSFAGVDTDESESLYLPSINGLRLASLGYQNALARYLWFKTVSYFGKHYQGNGKYTFLAHMCDLVVTLDPLTEHVYPFCATMLSWEANAPERAIQILSKGITAQPKNWLFRYLRGFNYMHFMKDDALAGADFSAAAALPEAPKAMLEKLSRKLGKNNPESTVEVLTESLKTAQDPIQRQALTARLLEAVYHRDVYRLRRGLEIYKNRTGKEADSLQALVTEGILRDIPRDPWGAEYVYNVNEDSITSVEGVKRNLLDE